MSRVIIVNGNDCYKGVTLRYENVISVTTETLGWTQQWGYEPYGDGIVTKLIGYIGGEGVPPTENIGNYVGIDGFVEDISDAVVHGRSGTQGFTPYIGINENWWINGVDTGFPSRGDVPVITIEGGIWFIDGVSTGQQAQGEDGKEIELQKTSTFIQWRYVGDNGWFDLVALDDIKGNDGETIVNINPDSPTSQARLWIGTQVQFDTQQPIPDDVLVFII